MSRIPLFLSFVLAAVVALAQTKPTTPRIEVSTPRGAADKAPPGKVGVVEGTFDAGKVQRGAVVTHQFKIPNAGDGTLRITAKPG